MKLTAIKVGATFNRWTLVAHAEPAKYGRKIARGLMRCECGKERVVVLSDVVSGRSRSCGCLGKQVQRAMNAAVFA